MVLRLVQRDPKPQLASVSSQLKMGTVSDLPERGGGEVEAGRLLRAEWGTGLEYP